MIVEDGQGLANADAYVTVDYCSDYCTERGLTFGTSPTLVGEQAIVRATAALDAIYRGRFSGYKTHGRDQSLEWPRTASYDREFYTLPNDEIPTEVKYATCEMAVRELADPGSMMPDLERGGQVRRLKAGSVEIEYGSNSMAQTTFQLVDGIMSGLLGSQPLSFVGVAVRG